MIKMNVLKVSLYSFAITIIVFFIAFWLELVNYRLFAPDFLNSTAFLVVFVSFFLQVAINMWH